mmetsp:Transcript_24363/g.39820  ORF Transcript_24363/g.39820 Transcript_24363/m.39820 type:complete len:266 (+) Transcript_24363:219-1016(+)
MRALLTISCMVVAPLLPFAVGLAIGQDTCASAGRRLYLAIFPFATVFPEESFASTVVASSPSRDVDVGGGFDLLTQKLPEKDVVYPKSMKGNWICERSAVKVEGDTYQAESAYRCLGSKENLRPGSTEKFETRFIESPYFGASGVVLDRGFEIASRTQNTDSVQWNVDNPNLLEYGKTKILVVRRSVEEPNDKGFGFDELLRVDDLMVTRAIQVKRRYRRAFDENGNRIVEGLEIMKTFRVLDGVAGTEFPTATVKSQIRMAVKS